VQFTLQLATVPPRRGSLVLTDPLPSSLSYVAGSASAGLVYDAAQNTLRWQGALAAHTTVTWTFAARIDNTPGGTVLLNTAYLSDASVSLCRQCGRHVVAPDLRSSSKKAQPQVVRGGQEITYTVTLTNSGLGASSVSVVDPLPAGVSYVAGSASGGAVYNSLFSRIEWSGWSLPPNWGYRTMP